MKIAILAPPYLPVPPHGYGGTEQIVSTLTEGLVQKGHDVTLYATGDSVTHAHLVSVYPQALGNDGTKKADVLLPLLHYARCFRDQESFDIIHSHAQYLGLFFSEFARVPVVHTWHGSYYQGEVPEEKRAVLANFSKQPIITISNNQRGGMPELTYVATVYNGIRLADYPFIERSTGGYLLWVGRIVEKKGPLAAIEVARKLNIPLKMAAVVDPIDQPYFDRVVGPNIDNKLITLTGELHRGDIAALYGNALATLYPITWHEPFGLVMAESMATGTPVVAYNSGSVPEIIEDGATGFVVGVAEGIDGLARAVRNVGSIDRTACRARAATHFSSETMVEAYENVYQTIVAERKNSL